MSKDNYIIPIFIPHKGCPHDCVFCNQKKISGTNKNINEIDVDETIKKYLETIPKKTKNVEIAYYGGSFTGIDIELQEKLLKVATKYKSKGFINRIRLSTRPDYISTEVLQILKDNNVDIIELGVQSLDECVLKASNRGHTSSDVMKAVVEIRRFDFLLGLQMMIGLPGDNEEKNIATANKIIALKPDFVRIYPTLVVKDTYLEIMYRQGIYTPLSVNDAVDISSKLLMLFEAKDIKVIRIGLQPTDNVSLGNDIIAGPYHPSFRQLVESEIYGKILVDSIENNNLYAEHILIEINPRLISYLVGQKSENLNLMKKMFNIKNIKVISKNISTDYFVIVSETKRIVVNRKEIIKHFINTFI